MTAPASPTRDIGWLARAGFFVVLPGVGVGGALGLPLLTGLAAAASFRFSLVREAVRRRPAWLIFLLAFVAWATISSAWSPYANHSEAARFPASVLAALLFAAAATRDGSARRLTLAGGAAACLVLAGLLLIEILAGMPFNRASSPDSVLGELARDPSRGAVVLLALTWGPAGYFLSQSRTGAAVLVALLSGAVMVVQREQMANLVAFAAGLAAFLVGFTLPRLAILAATGGWALWMLAAPWLTPILVSNSNLVNKLPDSWAARVGIWKYACARIAEQPWLGHGLDSAHMVTDRIQVRWMHMRGIPSHPHSATLHIWYDTGAVGAVLAAAVLIAGGWALSRALAHNRPAAAAACGALAALGIIFNVSFGAWAEWWDVTMILAATLIAAFAIKAAKA